MNSVTSAKVVGDMTYNPKLQRWDGNEKVLRAFESRTSRSSNHDLHPRPAPHQHQPHQHHRRGKEIGGTERPSRDVSLMREGGRVDDPSPPSTPTLKPRFSTSTFSRFDPSQRPSPTRRTIPTTPRFVSSRRKSDDENLRGSEECALGKLSSRRTPQSPPPQQQKPPRARPSLITHVGDGMGGNGDAAQVVGTMVFDPVQMRWINTEGEEEDVFAGLDDEEDAIVRKHATATSDHTTTTANGSETPSDDFSPETETNITIRPVAIVSLEMWEERSSDDDVVLPRRPPSSSAAAADVKKVLSGPLHTESTAAWVIPSSSEMDACVGDLGVKNSSSLAPQPSEATRRTENAAVQFEGFGDDKIKIDEDVETGLSISQGNASPDVTDNSKRSSMILTSSPPLDPTTTATPSPPSTVSAPCARGEEFILSSILVSTFHAAARAHRAELGRFWPRGFGGASASFDPSTSTTTPSSSSWASSSAHRRRGPSMTTTTAAITSEVSSPAGTRPAARTGMSSSSSARRSRPPSSFSFPPKIITDSRTRATPSPSPTSPSFTASPRKRHPIGNTQAVSQAPSTTASGRKDCLASLVVRFSSHRPQRTQEQQQQQQRPIAAGRSHLYDIRMAS